MGINYFIELYIERIITIKYLKIFGIVFIFVLISYLTYFNDLFAYLEIKNNPTEFGCRKYLSNYSNGFYVEDVKFIELSLIKDINKIRDFMREYPNSSYKHLVEIINNNVWKTQIDKYLSRIKNSENKDFKAVNFFTDLLYYLRDNYTNKISLYIDGVINLKEYKEYSLKSKKMCKAFCRYINQPTNINQLLIPFLLEIIIIKEILIF